MQPPCVQNYPFFLIQTKQTSSNSAHLSADTSISSKSKTIRSTSLTTKQISTPHTNTAHNFLLTKKHYTTEHKYQKKTLLLQHLTIIPTSNMTKKKNSTIPNLKSESRQIKPTNFIKTRDVQPLLFLHLLFFNNIYNYYFISAEK